MTGLHRLLQCSFCGCLVFEPKESYIFALTSMSLRDLPLLYDIIGRFRSVFFSIG